ncbi:MAG TPA: FecR domain-containing protein [Steroidobacteraceae bacterium]|jgi:transmembrane sensor|nr:FecR domain-containing protein [Steroidobacteraceae bacterium]
MKAHANSQILEEASTWFVELSEGHLADKVREQFSDWLRASPEHVRAYLQISALWEDAPLLGKGAEDVEALIARTRAAGNVVRVGKDRQPSSVKSRRFMTPLRSALAAGLVLVAIGITFWLQQRGVYETAIGEERSLTLADGSTIELNAQSRVRVHFTAAERSIDLLEGQVLFHVTHDAARPFIVHSGAASVRAVGTQFDVDRRSGETVVTVVEGRVAVLPDLLLQPMSANAVDSSAPSISAPDFVRTGPGGAGGLLLTAGEQVTLTAQATSRPTRTDVAAAIAWTQRKLVFAASPLTQVADEYNRYHLKRIVISDRRLASFLVSGVFSATDSRAFVAFLRAQPNLTVKETDTEIEISGAPPK